MKNILNEIKWAYQRVIKGYDNRIQWEFDTYFNQFIPPLQEFCENELKKESANNKLNPVRENVFSETLRLIEEFKKWKHEDFYKFPNPSTELWEHFGKHITYYWN